jgi:hypothetical protein
MNKILNFLSGLQTLEQRAKKGIELHREYVEQIPSFVAVDCFFPGRAKDLSASPLTSLFSYIVSHTGVQNFLVSWRLSRLSESSFTFRRIWT